MFEVLRARGYCPTIINFHQWEGAAFRVELSFVPCRLPHVRDGVEGHRLLWPTDGKVALKSKKVKKKKREISRFQSARGPPAERAQWPERTEREGTEGGEGVEFYQWQWSPLHRGQG